jgi:hypothetical protein
MTALAELPTETRTALTTAARLRDYGEVARILSASIVPEIEPELDEPHPINIDSRPCGKCGCTIDRHRMVDDGDGPIFYCVDLDPDELTLEELERRAELRRQENVAAIIARIEAMDDPSQRQAPQGARKPRLYRPAASTIDAFKYVVGLNDADYLARWLADHPADAPELFKIWKGKQC